METALLPGVPVDPKQKSLLSASAAARQLGLRETSSDAVGSSAPELLKLDSIPCLEVDACSCARAVVSVFAGGPTMAR
jgi:hypothetical protein